MFDWAMLLCVCLIIGFCSVLLAPHGISPLRPGSYINNAMLYCSAGMFFELYFYSKDLLAARPDSPIKFTLKRFRQRWQILKPGLLLILSLILFMPNFSTMKAAIPLFNEFGWDAVFIQADRVIFGTDAWKILQPVLGYPIVTSALSIAYHAWILLIYAGGIYFAVYQRQIGRRYIAYHPSFFSFPLMMWPDGP